MIYLFFIIGTLTFDDDTVSLEEFIKTVLEADDTESLAPYGSLGEIDEDCWRSPSNSEHPLGEKFLYRSSA